MSLVLRVLLGLLKGLLMVVLPLAAWAQNLAFNQNLYRQDLFVGDPLNLLVSFYDVSTGKEVAADGMEFRWYRNGVLTRTTSVPAYTLASASLADAGNYHVVVTTTDGKELGSRLAEIHVDSPQAPEFLGPLRGRLYEGGGGYLEARMRGLKGASFAWNWEDHPLESGGLATQRLEFSNRAALYPGMAGEAGVYSLKVTGPLGSASLSSFPQVLRKLPQSWALNRAHYRVSTGDLVRLANGTSPVPAVTGVLWYKDGVLLPHYDRTLEFSASPATAGVYTQVQVGSEGTVLLDNWLVSVDSVGTSVLPVVETPSLDTVVPEARPGILAADGLIYRFSRGRRFLVAWSPESRQHVKAIALAGVPDSVAYSPEQDRAYLSHVDGRVTYLDLKQASPLEQPFLPPGDSVVHLFPCGSSLLVLHRVPASPTNSYGNDVYWSMFDAEGHLVGSYTSAQFSGGNLLFDAAGARLLSPSPLESGVVRAFPLRDGRFVLDEKGVPSLERLVMDQANRTSPVSSFLHVGPRYLVDREGQVYDLGQKAFVAALPEIPDDVAQSPAAVYSFVAHSLGSSVRKWSADFTTAEKSVTLEMRALSLHCLPDGRLVLVGEHLGAPRYAVLSESLEVLGEARQPVGSRLANLSIQALLGEGEGRLVPGFVIKGTDPKAVLLRAVGPGLAQFNVPGLLADPELTLFDSKQAIVDHNDDHFTHLDYWNYKQRPGESVTVITDAEVWRAMVAGAAQRAACRNGHAAALGAFALPSDSKDSLLIKYLAPGLFTGEATSFDGGTGRVLVELYDAELVQGGSRLVNLSARCLVSPDGVAVGGFVVKGTSPLRVLVRAVGPGLSDFGVSNVLKDPKLRLFKGQTVVGQTDNWSADVAGQAALQAAFAKTGAFALPAGSKDAALLVDLEPGDYTVWMESADGSSGVALFELYLVE